MSLWITYKEYLGKANNVLCVNYDDSALAKTSEENDAYIQEHIKRRCRYSKTGLYCI